jgi:hypothetical protein
MRRMERPDRSTDQWVELIQSRQVYNSGERFSSANMASCIDTDTNTALRILNVMTQRGLVNVTKEKRGAAHAFWYTKAKTSIDPIRIPWRTCSNAFTGSPHYQRIGVPI